MRASIGATLRSRAFRPMKPSQPPLYKILQVLEQSIILKDFLTERTRYVDRSVYANGASVLD